MISKHHPILKYDDPDEKQVDRKHDDADHHRRQYDDDDLFLKENMMMQLKNAEEVQHLGKWARRYRVQMKKPPKHEKSTSRSK